MILDKIESDNNFSLYITAKKIRDMIFGGWTGILRAVRSNVTGNAIEKG